MTGTLRKTIFIIAWIVFLTAIFIKEGLNLVGIYGLTAEKVYLIVGTTILFVIITSLAILLVLKRFGYSPRDIKIYTNL